MFENEVFFGFCGKMDYCGVFKRLEVGFWKGDYFKGEF